MRALVLLFASRYNYAIGDGNGNRDGRLGIQLGQIDDLQIIEAFQPGLEEKDDKAINDTSTPPPTMPSTRQSTDPTTLHQKAVKVDIYNGDGIFKESRSGYLTIDEDEETLTFHSEGRKPLHLPLINMTPDYTVHWVRSKREPKNRQPDGFGYGGHQYLFFPVSQTTETEAEEAIGEALDPLSLEDLAGVDGIQAVETTSEPVASPKTEPQQQTTPRNHTMASPAEERATKRPSVYAEDLERMNRLMLERNVTGSTAEVFRALLETFAAETQTSKRQQVETMDNFAQTLNWFTQRVSQLEQERDQLRQERDRLQAQQGDPRNTDEMDQLRERNTQLEQELQQTQSRLNRIHILLGGSDKGAATSQPVAAAQPETTSPVVAPKRTGTTTSQPEKDEPPTRKRDRDESVDNIAEIVDAIIKWNTAQERSEMRLQISFPTIKSLAVLVNSASHPAIREVMKQKGPEIDEIHARFMMGSRHNRSVKDKDGVLQAIARDYLGFSNWQDAEYTN